MEIISKGFSLIPTLDRKRFRNITEEEMNKAYYQLFADTFLRIYADSILPDTDLVTIQWEPPYVNLVLATKNIQTELDVIFDNIS